MGTLKAIKVVKLDRISEGKVTSEVISADQVDVTVGSLGEAIAKGEVDVMQVKIMINALQDQITKAEQLKPFSTHTPLQDLIEGLS